jgi:hypothetical protein
VCVYGEVERNEKMRVPYKYFRVVCTVPKTLAYCILQGFRNFCGLGAAFVPTYRLAGLRVINADLDTNLLTVF